MDILRSQKQNDDFWPACVTSIWIRKKWEKFCWCRFVEMISIAYGQQPPNDQHERCFATYWIFYKTREGMIIRIYLVDTRIMTWFSIFTWGIGCQVSLLSVSGSIHFYQFHRDHLRLAFQMILKRKIVISTHSSVFELFKKLVKLMIATGVNILAS